MDTSAGARHQSQAIGGMAVPYPYELWASGLYIAEDDPDPEADPYTAAPALRGRERVTHRPLWIAGYGYTLDTAEPLVCLRFIAPDGRTEDLWTGRAEITDHNKLAALGAKGLPVDTLSAKRVLAFLRLMEARNAPTSPVALIGKRSGPYIMQNGHVGWLVGSQWIGPEGTSVIADPRGGQARFTLGLRAHGNYESWLDFWRTLRHSWVTRFLIASTFAAPLLRTLRCRTFILHHWGDSSSGKTATAMFAMSAWGAPDLLYSSLNRTAVSLTEVFKHVTDLPVLFDEKQVSTVSSEELIYSVCAGTGRERGAKEGGLRPDRTTWITIARTTGEVPLVTNRDVGGQFNRVLQIHSNAFGDRKAAEAVYPFVAQNYGHAGPHFLQLLGNVLAQPDGERTLRSLYESMRRELELRTSCTTSNHVAYAAAVATAQLLSEVWLLNEDAVAARETALSDAARAVDETAPNAQLPYAERALNLLRDHWIANRYLYIDDTTAEGREQQARVARMVGIEAEWAMIFIPSEANMLLVNAGFEPERVWRDFDKRGWLITTGGGDYMTRASLRNAKSPEHPVYAIRPTVFYSESRSSLRLVAGGLSLVR